MKTYKNLSGQSGVVAYEVGKTFIRIKFEGDSGVYIYDYSRPGRSDVEQMKALAIKGIGLSTYISQHVRTNYAARK